METKKYKVRLNSEEKIEELLQESYDQACRMINEIQNEINKLTSSTNLGSEDTTMDDKGKYAKAMHDYMGDKSKAIAQKIEIAKFMGEILKHGDAKSALEDPTLKKRTSLNLSSLKAAIEGDDDSNTYMLKKN